MNFMGAVKQNRGRATMSHYRLAVPVKNGEGGTTRDVLVSYCAMDNETAIFPADESGQATSANDLAMIHGQDTARLFEMLFDKQGEAE